jgi:3-phosphoshikimate 1-carboxyvinyltransferase
MLAAHLHARQARARRFDRNVTLQTMQVARPLQFRVRPGGRLRGRVRVPGDKSISHRGVMLGAIAEGITRIDGFLRAADCLATISAFRAMGVRIDEDANGEVRVHGVGLRGLKAASSALDLGNSGTSMRLLAGLLCGQAFNSELRGDASLNRRPMRRIAEPLRGMGAVIQTSEQDTPPLRIHGRRLRGAPYRMPMASAQVKSSILLAGLYAHGETTVIEPEPTRDHTERMLTGFGCTVRRDANRVTVRGGGTLKATLIDVPSDISTAAFLMVGASIAPGSELVLERVGVNPTRSGVIEILRRMGANIMVLDEGIVNGEPVADLRVKHASLQGIPIPRALVPLAIDEFPAIFIAAACARGTTVLNGAEELRVKESDRIEAAAAGLRACGITAETSFNGMVIHGGRMRGGLVDSHGDHRIAMAFAMGGLAADGEIIVQDCDNVATSFPGFPALAREAGLDISVL